MSETEPNNNKYNPNKNSQFTLMKLLKPLASLELTVVLFVLSLVLVFAGTLAQVDNPIWTAVSDYFRSFYVFIPNQVFARFCQTFRWISPTAQWPGSFPFPGGWTIGGLMLANLLAAHAVRFKFSMKRIGIISIHAGIILLMLGELITGIFAVEGNMTIEQGGVTNYLELKETSGFMGKVNGPELAFSDMSIPKKEKVVVIPNHLLRTGGKISTPLLPFDIEIIKYMNNSSVEEIDPDKKEEIANLANIGDGVRIRANEKNEASGTDKDQKIDLPSAYINLIDKKTGKSVGTYLASIWLSLSSLKPTQSVITEDGTKTEMALRFKRSYKPFSMELIEFKHERYLGTNTPKNFSSKIKLSNESLNENRETLISMNNPLRYDGETFYQSGFLPNDKGTILQVVRNPGWLMPYLSCLVVSFGMLLHFGMHLNTFLKKRATSNV